MPSPRVRSLVVSALVTVAVVGFAPGAAAGIPIPDPPDCVRGPCWPFPCPLCDDVYFLAQDVRDAAVDVVRHPLCNTVYCTP